MLGPLLFLIYVNDISDSLLSLTRLFADDSSLYYSATSITDIEGIINHDLTLISAWAKKWLVTFNPNKTEAVLFSLKNNNNLPELVFQDTDITFVENHKHLGLTLNKNGNWDAHVENILQSASKVIGIMKRLKYTLNRKSLNQIYLSYIAPILEYSSIVWNGCSESCSCSLQKLQNEAARIVTGLTRSVSLENLFRECGWQSLKERRDSQKLFFMYKATHDMVPTYISDLIPPTVGEINQYSLRNTDNVRNLHTRTTVSQKSCIPSSINMWNNLDTSTRNIDSSSGFKRIILQKSPPKIVPPYYLAGNRFLSTMHARVRNKCSDLNSDLFHNHLRQDPYCSCFTEIEDAEHFLLRCKNHENQRLTLFNSTRNFHPLNVDILLFGKSTLTTEQTTTIFTAVQEFIKKSKRFCS